jgi:RNA polymerase sigma-70 factor (ECF subfamily)
VSPVSGPAEIVAARVDVDAALQHVPEEFRVAVVLRDLCDFDYAEIAEVLDLPPGTVRSRISRGRAILVERLGPGPAGPAFSGPALSGNSGPAGERQNDDG